MMRIFCEKVVLPFLECNTARQAVRIKNINDQMTLGRRGEKRSTNPASNKTNFTPLSKKSTTPVQKDPDADEANNSVLIMSTIHPVEYLGTPPPSNMPSSGRLEIQEIPTRRMDDEVSDQLDIQEIPTKRMDGKASGPLEIQKIPTRRMDDEEAIQAELEGGSSPAEGMDQELPVLEMEGQQVTSTPNLTPESTPTKKTAQSLPVPHFLSGHSAVPPCPDAADFLESPAARRRPHY